ncbi:hypothetical protein NL444_28030, partial [Klebsiella pneumoniae]|nr:hypothetical protein [Klebsiella pneumoniae]
GEYKFDHQKKMLHWRIPVINSDNPEGALEFSVPEMDGDEFFPINVTFESNETLSGIAITGVVQAEANDQEVAHDVDIQMG